HELGLRGWRAELDELGVEVVLDTCTYYPPQPSGVRGTVMTNSAKWAYYAPGMLPIDVVFGGLQACADAAVTGQVGGAA
ncbi:MAG: aconitase X, partial [Acidimicrobiaceae bacterium]